MSTQAVTLRLPFPLYELFKSRAEHAERSVEVELLEVVATAAEEQAKLPQDLVDAVAGLAVLNDEALWRAARTTLPEEDRKELEGLNFKQQSGGLTQIEQQRQEQLLHSYDRVMLVRAHAARTLNERGHDVSILLDAR